MPKSNFEKCISCPKYEVKSSKKNMIPRQSKMSIMFVTIASFFILVLCFVLFEGYDPFDDFIEQGGIDTIDDVLPALDRTD